MIFQMGNWMVWAIPFMLILIAIPVLLAAFWIWMLIDCITRNFSKSEDKIIWVIVIVFTTIIGALIYYFLVKNKKGRKR